MMTRIQALFGFVLLLAGGLKIWAHASSATWLALPSCAGKTVLVPISSASTLDQIHCWGCYVAAMGAVLIVIAIIRSTEGRRLTSRLQD